MKDIVDLLSIVPARRRQRILFNMSSYRFFRASEHGDLLLVGNPRSLLLLTALPGVLLMELLFWRCQRYFIKLNDGVVGAFVLSEKHDRVFLRCFGVARRFRGSGIGSFALRHIVKMAEANGKKWVRLAVTKSNKPAQRLYVKFGFVLEKERKWSLSLKKRIG